MLKVYGHPASQPSRSVIWACVLHELPFTLMAPDPNEKAFISPRGQLPVIDDEGFVLSEMPAILSYLGEKHGWDAMYPDDIRLRARIAQYLHAHHSLTRLATTKLMAPHVLVAFGGNPTSNPLSYIDNSCIQASMDDNDGLATGQQLISQVIEFLEQAYLGDHDFIAGTSHATIADLACYEEIWQLEEANLLDLSGRARIQAWFRRMMDLPSHSAVHCYNRVLGDIRSTPNTMERFTDAVTRAFSSLSKLKYVHMT
ncbi:MAG: glutathione S-transferase family protein [Pseudomonadota bacterium]